MTIIVNFQESAAIVTLNRPHRYNAADLDTISQITEFLNKAREEDSIKKIILTSDHPKAFCAGGDIRMAYDAIKSKNFQHGNVFFEAEYKLVYDLATYPKPVISLVNGICFGGGMGLSMHNHFRILTENAILGMPETIIGFFPDVGSSYRFAQFPKAWANFYGLTGNNIALSHALKWNMADYFVPSALLPELLNNLCSASDDRKLIEQFSCEATDAPILAEAVIENAFANPLLEIFESLQNDPSEEAQKILLDLNSRSPLSLMVTDKLLEMSPFLDLKKSLELDQILASNFMFNPDLQEGIRAQIIDKDRQPKWHYKIANIDAEIIRDFFVPTYFDSEILYEN